MRGAKVIWKKTEAFVLLLNNKTDKKKIASTDLINVTSSIISISKNSLFELAFDKFSKNCEILILIIKY